MAYALLLIGSNINPEKNVRKAVEFISLSFRVIKTSGFVKTRPYKIKNAPGFINLVMLVRTPAGLQKLKKILKEYESNAGRTSSEHGFRSRKIDIDILFYHSKNKIYINKKEFSKTYTLLAIISALKN